MSFQEFLHYGHVDAKSLKTARKGTIIVSNNKFINKISQKILDIKNIRIFVVFTETSNRAILL